MDSDPKKDKKVAVDGADELPPNDVQASPSIDTSGVDADDVVDIDPADFFDIEEFGYRRLQGRFGRLRRP